MYIAHKSIDDDDHHGSTKLHIDMTDAVNIMVWAPSTQGEHYALWRIFPQAASPIVCEFLRTRHHEKFPDAEHPIHSQAIYFTPSMLEELYVQYGILPFTIRQHVGEAIFIPAGCAHQVSDTARRMPTLLNAIYAPRSAINAML